MNATVTTTVRYVLIGLSVLVASLALSDALADDHKIKDQTLTINVNADNCVESITADQHDNCQAEFGDENNPCKGKKDCICSNKDKHITWQIVPAQEFEIQLTSSSNPNHKTPFKQCDLKSGSDGDLKCKVHHKGTYTYEVAVKACEGSGYDPIIIVGHAR
ncbi:hypothetical protein [Thalassotalea maritima]|uniref:hypothetical protein n=1 Tax=Thalassotalea maritima TaxID=3242416 RepID=UPI003528C1C8